MLGVSSTLPPPRSSCENATPPCCTSPSSLLLGCTPPPRVKEPYYFFLFLFPLKFPIMTSGPISIIRVVNSPLKNRKSRQILPSLGISHNLLMGLGVSDFVSVGRIYAFLSSHSTFLSWSRILKCQSWCLDESRIYHSPPL